MAAAATAALQLPDHPRPGAAAHGGSAGRPPPRHSPPSPIGFVHTDESTSLHPPEAPPRAVTEASGQVREPCRPSRRLHSYPHRARRRRCRSFTVATPASASRVPNRRRPRLCFPPSSLYTLPALGAASEQLTGAIAANNEKPQRARKRDAEAPSGQAITTQAAV